MADIPPEPPDPPEPLGDANASPPTEVRPPLLDRLGPRAVRRLTPRVGIVVAAAGTVIAVGGATGLGGDQLVSDGGDVQRIPGILISLAVIAAGYAVLSQRRSGPLATAGATAAALGVPVLFFFLTFTTDDLPPFSVDAVLLVSTVAWFGAYVLGPSIGRLLFLGLALTSSWIFVLDQIEPVLSDPFSFLPFDPMGVESGSDFGFSEEFEDLEDDEFGVGEEFDFDDEFDFDVDSPDPTNLGVVSILFGGGYMLASLLLSRRGYAGSGTPFAAVGVVALIAAVGFLASDLEALGTGVLLVVLGLAVATIGAASARRFTTWTGGVGVAFGVLTLTEEAVGDSSTTTISLVSLVVGVAVVAAGHLIGSALAEPDEEDEARSFEQV